MVEIGVFSSWVILLIKSFLISDNLFCLKMMNMVRIKLRIMIRVRNIEEMVMNPRDFIMKPVLLGKYSEIML